MLVLLVSLLANGELVLAHTHHWGFGWGSGSGEGSGCHDCEQTPVCGDDGVNYPSPCMADCNGAAVECEGECPCECPPDQYKEMGEGCFDENHQYIRGCVCYTGCKACGFYESPVDDNDCLACYPGYTFKAIFGSEDYCGEPSPPSGECVPITTMPSMSPSMAPSVSPTQSPSVSPTLEPTITTFMPTVSPTMEPTPEKIETFMPTVSPTMEPTPEKIETFMPTVSPTKEPTPEITGEPTAPTDDCAKKFGICKDAGMDEVCCPEGQMCYAKTPEQSLCRPKCPGTWFCADETTIMPTSSPTVEPTDAVVTPAPTPAGDDCAAKFQVCKDVGMPEVCCPEGQECFAKNSDQSLCRPKCPGTWDCAKVTESPTPPPTEDGPCDPKLQTATEKAETVSDAMDVYRHTLVQRTGSAKTTEPITYVWSQPNESCHQACIDAAGAERNLYCYSDAMFGSTFDITDQMDPFCGVTDDLVCIKPPKTQSQSKSTRAPFRRERDGKCFRTGAAKGRHDCTWVQNGARRFCGCLGYEHIPKDHLQEQPAGRTEDNPVGWNRVSDDSCDRFCAAAGLTCSLDKLNDVRGVYDMLDLFELVKDDIDGARCKIWDARFSKAQAPKYRAQDGYCTVAPMENNQKKASCATKQTGSDFRLCYCE